MPRQGAERPNPRDARERQAEERDRHDKKALEKAAIFVPAARFGEVPKCDCE